MFRFVVFFSLVGCADMIDPIVYTSDDAEPSIPGVQTPPIVELENVSAHQVGVNVEFEVTTVRIASGAVILGVSWDGGSVTTAVTVQVELGYGVATVPLPYPCDAIAAGAADVIVWSDIEGIPWTFHVQLTGTAYGDGDRVDTGDMAVFCGTGDVRLNAGAGSTITAFVPGTLVSKAGSLSTSTGVGTYAFGWLTFEPDNVSSEYVLTVERGE